MKRKMKQLNKSLLIAFAMLFVFLPILNAEQGFGNGLNTNQQQTGFFSDAYYPLEGDFNATTYPGHSGYGSIDMNKGYSTYGQPIHATKDGVVQKAVDNCANIGYVGSSCNGGYGNHVIIDHGNGFDSLYGHMISGSVKVRTGQKVKAGDVIGYTGTSGNSSGPHVHFEIRKNDQSVPVKNYFYFSNITENNPNATR